MTSADNSPEADTERADGPIERTRLERAVLNTSFLFSWLFPILMLAIVAQVVLRSAGFNQAWLDDLQWWLYGSAALIGIGYAVTTDTHVRVDIFYDNFTKQRKNRIEVFALAWLLLPFVILSWDITIHYAVSSVATDEGSDSPNGLHNLWLLKCFMNASFIFIGVAAWAAYERALAALTEPLLWRKLLYAFPTTMFLVNLASYYVLWWWVYLTGPEDMTARQVSRTPIFDEFEFGNYEIKYTVMIALVLTIVLIAAAWAAAQRRSREG